jgi:2-polyprenyl-3-methyl-5-hydroxy-6-metoxy-1,4-benzoquinol methylase
MTNVICRRCGLVYANPRLAREPLDRFYREQVYPEFLRDGQFTARLINSSIHQATQTFAFFNEVTGDQFAGRRLLEIGPGLGDFLVLARDAGAEVLGVEMDGLYADFAERERRVPILRKHVEALEAGDMFDFIALFHVLEHLENPQATLRSLRTRLKPRGQLLIEVPNFLAPWRTWPTEFFRVEHTYNFSLETLRALLALTGFSIVAHDREPFLLRVVAEPSTEAVALPFAPHHYEKAVRHLVKWRLRAALFAPYYALRRALSPAAHRRR